MKLLDILKNLFAAKGKGLSGVIEILLIVAVVVAICALFKTNATTLVTDAFTSIGTKLTGLFG